MDEQERLTLQNVCGGALTEVFERDFQQVIDNIADPNTEAEKVRSITIKLTFNPFNDRSGAIVSVKSDTKLPGIPAQTSTMFIDRRDGKNVGVPKDTRQKDMFKAENVTEIRREEQA